MVLGASAPVFVAGQNEVTLTPSKDNTLYESSTGALSNGAGEYLFAGATNFSFLIRRALVAFDVADNIPAGAVIDSVLLTMHVSKTVAGPKLIRVHRVMSDWGEGTSDALGEEGSGIAATPGDATWLHSFFNTVTWNSAGGDFVPIESASISVDSIGFYTWGATGSMASDVQGWLDSPSTNFGWMIRGEESTPRSSKRFDSRENGVTNNTPKLVVYYTIPVDIELETVHPAIRLAGNFPNPFSATTKIIFELDSPTAVSIDVIDMLGRSVNILFSTQRRAGYNEVEFDATGFTPGIYLYRLSVEGGESLTGKMTLVR